MPLLVVVQPIVMFVPEAMLAGATVMLVIRRSGYSLSVATNEETALLLASAVPATLASVSWLNASAETVTSIVPTEASPSGNWTVVLRATPTPLVRCAVP